MNLSITQKISSNKKIILICVIGLIATIGIAAAATVLTSNHIAHPNALPTPTPPPQTPTPTPTPEPSPSPATAVTLTANDTGIMYGDKITFTAQLNQPASNILILYYNNSTEYGQYFTDATGKAVFTRGPFTGAYDCYVTATIPES
jgi:flagellar basal body-associated protein FliL